MPESGLGAVPMIALASLNGFHYPSDIESSSRWYENGADLIDIQMDENGLIEVPQTVGIQFDEAELYRTGRLIRAFSLTK